MGRADPTRPFWICNSNHRSGLGDPPSFGLHGHRLAVFTVKGEGERLVKQKSLGREKMTQKPSYYSRSDLVMRRIGLGHWWSNRQIQLMTRGKFTARHTPTERILKRKSEAGLLSTAWYGKTKIYALASKSKNVNLEDTSKIYHGLCSTETMLRFWFSKMEAEIMPERDFRGCSAVPDWGIRYPSGKIICAEFSTEDNVKQRLKSKLTVYGNHLDEIEAKLNAKAIVVFILDIPRDEIRERVGLGNGMSAGSAALRPDGDRFPLLPFRFVDYGSVLSVPLGKVMQTPIFISTDGKEYSLAK